MELALSWSLLICPLWRPRFAAHSEKKKAMYRTNMNLGIAYSDFSKGQQCYNKLSGAGENAASIPACNARSPHSHPAQYCAWSSWCLGTGAGIIFVLIT
jgi:hypothetical protein